MKIYTRDDTEHGVEYVTHEDAKALIEKLSMLESQYAAQVTAAKLFSRECDAAVKLLQWFILQCQGDSGTGESYWEQFEEYRIARMLVSRLEELSAMKVSDGTDGDEWKENAGV